MAVGKKHAGRKKGVPNKITQVNRAFISDLLNEQGNNIQNALNDLYTQNKQAYLSCIIKMLDHVLPRLKDQDIEDNNDARPIHIFKLKGTDKITFNNDRARDNN